MTPEIIYVKNGDDKLRTDSNPWASQARAESRTDPPTSWYQRSCRYQWIDRLMIVACLVASMSLVSWTIAQEVAGDKTPTAEPPTAEATGEATASEATASETTVSEATAGETTAGETTAGETTAGEATAGEAAQGPRPATTDEANAGLEKSRPGTLDVEPLGVESIDDNVARVLGAEARPEWVETTPVSAGGLDALVVSSDPKMNHESALASLDTKIRDSLEEYIDNYLGVPHAHRYLPFDLDHYKSRLIVDEADRYDEIVKYSVGTMHESHAKLTIDDSFRQDVHSQWREVVTSMRLFRTGGITVGVLALTLVVFSYFRLDTATRGYYSGRLRMFGGLAILGLIAGAVYFSRYNLEWLQLMINP